MLSLFFFLPALLFSEGNSTENFVGVRWNHNRTELELKTDAYPHLLSPIFLKKKISQPNFGFWRFEERAGSREFLSLVENTARESNSRLTLKCNAIEPDECPTRSSGWFGEGLEFDGAKDKLTVVHNSKSGSYPTDAEDESDLRFAEGFAVELYINPTSAREHAGVVEKGGEARDTGFGIYLNPSHAEQGRVLFKVWGHSGQTAEIVSKSRLPFHRWTHVLATYQDRKIRLYLNHELDEERDFLAPLKPAKEAIKVGWAQWNGEKHFGGKVDELAISFGRNDSIDSEIRERAKFQLFRRVGYADLALSTVRAPASNEIVKNPKTPGSVFSLNASKDSKEILDTSGYGNKPVCLRTEQFSCPTVLTDLQGESGIFFNGGSCLEVRSRANESIAFTNAFSIVLSLKAHELGNPMNIAHHSDGKSGFVLSITPEGRVMFKIFKRADTQYSVLSDDPIPLKKWIQIFAKYDGKSKPAEPHISLFLDGEMQAEPTPAWATSTFAGTQFTVGSGPDLSNALKGSIQNFSFSRDIVLDVGSQGAKPQQRAENPAEVDSIYDRAPASESKVSSQRIWLFSQIGQVQLVER